MKINGKIIMTIKLIIFEVYKFMKMLSLFIIIVCGLEYFINWIIK